MNCIFNDFLKTPKEISDWIEQYCHLNGSFSILPDDTYGFVVEVYGDICIGRYWESPNPQKISHVPVKFSAITKDLVCSNNSLSNLDFAPKNVGRDFFCHGNLLTSLKGCPEKIDGNFACANNELTSLKGGPLYVGKNYDCSANQLLTLEFIPKELGGKFSASQNEKLGSHQTFKNLAELEEVSAIYKHKSLLEKSLSKPIISPSYINGITNLHKI